MINGIKYIESNESGYAALRTIKDPKIQRKIIDIFNSIDKTLSFKGSNDNEMWKKIDYFLALGLYYFEFKDKFNELSEKSIEVLLLGEMYTINESNKSFISLFSNEELLSEIYNQGKNSNNLLLFVYSDYFFMIHEHFRKNPFDLNDKELCDCFIKEMILKINTKTLHNGVENMVEYWKSHEDIRKIVLGGGLSK
jgi:hypothetical protein